MRRSPSIWSDHLPDGIISTDFPENSMYEFLRERTVHALRRTAIEFEGKKTSYRTFLRHIDEIAASLLFHNIKEGDIVSVISPNIPQAVETIYAVNKIGAIANILHPQLPSAEIRHHIENTDSRAVFILDSVYAKIEKNGWKIDPPWIILYSIADALDYPKKFLVKRTKVPCGTASPGTDRVLSWKKFLKRHVETPVSCKGEADDVALILYSGGTTGVQKGVCLTNRNINCHAVQCQEVVGCTQYARTLAVMPIFHGFGLCTTIHSELTLGSHLFLLPTYNVDKCNSLIFKKRIKIISAVPAMYEALVRSDEMRTKDCGFLKYLICGGDRMKQQTERAFNSCMEERGLPTRILQGYGQTECVAACMSNALFRAKEGTAGMAFSDTELKIVSTETGEEMPAGAVGELCVCGPTVMKCYYKDEEATAQALRVHADGRTWLHTGDLFSVDEDGFYTFHGRRRRMFVVNGYNVYPEMIEKTMLRIPGIAQCCVVGIPARLGGDRIAAAVRLNDDGRDLTPRTILETCRSLLPDYAVPYKIVILEQFPVTGVGKVDYQRIAGEIGEGAR
ncbi:MAG: class I adenylate-forming enzyme family protein [Eubacteriales bacterium]|nr:class I adenylate-forming enzyme family protein [Eubacteriales bacterium]